jgi:hypothetical protein
MCMAGLEKFFEGYLYASAEYLRPWKVVSLLAGFALLIVGAFVTPAPDWDVPVTLIMGLSTYLTAPPTMRVLFLRKWHLLPIAAFATWLSVDGLYALYWHFRDPNVLALMRSANWPVSLALYGLCGIFCVYRGSLKALLSEVRAAVNRKAAG